MLEVIEIPVKLTFALAVFVTLPILADNDCPVTSAIDTASTKPIAIVIDWPVTDTSTSA